MECLWQNGCVWILDASDVFLFWTTKNPCELSWAPFMLIVVPNVAWGSWGWLGCGSIPTLEVLSWGNSVPVTHQLCWGEGQWIWTSESSVFFFECFFLVWETETVRDAGMPFKWLIFIDFWYWGLVKVNAENSLRCIRAAPYYSICSANGRDESFWMTGAIIHPYFLQKMCSAKSRESLMFFGGFWSRFIIFSLWSENCCTAVVTNIAET